MKKPKQKKQATKARRKAAIPEAKPAVPDPLTSTLGALLQATGQLIASTDSVAQLLARDVRSNESLQQALQVSVDERADAAEWRAAVYRGENDELVDIVESALVVMRSAVKAATAHHDPPHVVGCSICEKYSLDSRVKEIAARLRDRNARAKERARKLIDIGEV